jgi:hypothetical protein
VKLLLVDACRNDPASGRSLDAESLPRPPRGTAALFSCSSGQRAFETDKLRHGVFFHFVLEGLKGKARVEDDEVTWDDLARYVKRQVSRETPKLVGGGARQTPHEIRDLRGESPALLALGNPRPDRADTARVKRLGPRAKDRSKEVFVAGQDLKSIAFTAGSGWAVLYGRSGFHSSGIPDAAYKALQHYDGRGEELKSITFAPGGGWAILYGRNGFQTRGIPDEAYRRLKSFHARGEELKSIAFTAEGGWAILYGRNGSHTRGIPDAAYRELQGCSKRGQEIKSIAFTPGGGWAILHGESGYATKNIPDSAFRGLQHLAASGHKLKSIAFAPGGGWAILYGRNGFQTRGIPDSAFRLLKDLKN